MPTLGCKEEEEEEEPPLAGTLRCTPYGRTVQWGGGGKGNPKHTLTHTCLFFPIKEGKILNNLLLNIPLTAYVFHLFQLY
jgi:hypothetical protein